MLIGCCHSISAALQRALLPVEFVAELDPGHKMNHWAPQWALPGDTDFLRQTHFFSGLLLPPREARMAAKACAPSQLPLHKEADKQTASLLPSATAHDE